MPNFKKAEIVEKKRFFTDILSLIYIAEFAQKIFLRKR